MNTLNLSSRSYFPTLRTRQAELRGLKELEASDKEKIVPLLSLGQWRGSNDLEKSAEKAVEAMDGLPFFVDVSADTRKVEAHVEQLRSSTNAFENWRDFSRQFRGAIPIVQLPQGTRTREVVQQAQEIEREFGVVGFRIQDFAAQTVLTVSAISALADPRNAIVYVDCQYIRDAMAAFHAAAVSTINTLRTEFPSLFIVVLSTSFPSSTLRFADSTKQRGVIAIQERELHSRLGGTPVAAYGDHGSIHSVVYDDVPIMKWSPRIDYADFNNWHFERRSGGSSEQGYIECAQAIQQEFEININSSIWGERMIAEAALRRPFGKAPASWISVRVNIHLSKQINFEAQARDEEEDLF